MTLHYVAASHRLPGDPQCHIGVSSRHVLFERASQKIYTIDIIEVNANIRTLSISRPTFELVKFLAELFKLAGELRKCCFERCYALLERRTALG